MQVLLKKHLISCNWVCDIWYLLGCSFPEKIVIIKQQPNIWKEVFTTHKYSSLRNLFQSHNKCQQTVQNKKTKPLHTHRDY